MIQFRLNSSSKNDIETFKSYTLSCEELTTHQNAAEIKRIIIEVLSRFNLTLENVFSVTSDNGSNMIAAVRGMASDLQTNHCSNQKENEASGSDEEDFDIDNVELEVIEYDEEQETPQQDIITAHDVDLSAINNVTVSGET